MTVRLTESARWQLRAAAEAIAQQESVDRQRAFRTFVEALLERVEIAVGEMTPLPDFSDLPQNEVVRQGYRFFFRNIGDSVWLVGVWNAHESA